MAKKATRAKFPPLLYLGWMASYPYMPPKLVVHALPPVDTLRLRLQELTGMSPVPTLFFAVPFAIYGEHQHCLTWIRLQLARLPCWHSRLSREYLACVPLLPSQGSIEQHYRAARFAISGYRLFDYQTFAVSAEVAAQLRCGWAWVPALRTYQPWLCGPVGAEFSAAANLTPCSHSQPAAQVIHACGQSRYVRIVPIVLRNQQQTEIQISAPWMHLQKDKANLLWKLDTLAGVTHGQA